MPSLHVYSLTKGSINLALIIAALVIAIQNWDTSCDGTMMPLPIWLVIYACTIFSATFFQSIFLYKKYLIVFAILIIGDNLFILIWNIVGAVALFRDSEKCTTLAYPLWAMTLAALILQWIGFCYACCCVYTKKEEIKNNNNV